MAGSFSCTSDTVENLENKISYHKESCNFFENGQCKKSK